MRWINSLTLLMFPWRSKSNLGHINSRRSSFMVGSIANLIKISKKAASDDMEMHEATITR